MTNYSNVKFWEHPIDFIDDNSPLFFKINDKWRKLSSGEEYNIILFQNTGKMVVPTENINVYEQVLRAYGYKFNHVPCNHQQFKDYTKFFKIN